MKKRVLVLITLMDRAGAETLAMNYLRELDREKYHIDFLINRKEKSDYEDEIESLGCHVYHMCALKPFKVRQYIKEFNEFLDSQKPYDIIHSHLEEKSVYAFRIAKKRGIKTRIIHCHSNPKIKDLKYFMRIYLKKKLKNLYTVGLACSKKSAKWLLNNINVELIKNCVDTEKFKFNKDKREKLRKELDVGGLVITHVGRFSKEKNQEFILKVFSEIIKEKDATLLMVGQAKTKSEKKIRRKLVDKMYLLGIESYVKFLGMREDMENIYSMSDIVIMPSLSEGFPMTLVEAQTSGCKCIASDRITKKVNITGNVRFVSLNSKAKKWSEIILNTDISADRNNAYIKVRDEGYDIKKVIKKLERIYSE